MAEYERRRRNEYIAELAHFGFPSQHNKDTVGTNQYYNAFEEIKSMLKGETPLNLSRAVFIIENTYYGNALNYANYQNFIIQKVQICQQQIKKERLNPNDNLVKNMMIFRLLSDTIKYKSTNKEQLQTSYPILYDYEDYKSEKNYDSHFVTKLMRSGEGNAFPCLCTI